MATRLRGARPGRARRAKKVRFRSHRGTRSHGGSVFRAHRGFRKGGAVFRSHAARALAVKRARAAKPWKGPKAAAYRGIGKRNPYPARARARAFKAAGHRHGFAVRKKAARYRAVRARRV